MKVRDIISRGCKNRGMCHFFKKETVLGDLKKLLMAFPFLKIRVHIN